jgi:hypothetical protein
MAHDLELSPTITAPDARAVMRYELIAEEVAARG